VNEHIGLTIVSWVKPKTIVSDSIVNRNATASWQASQTSSLVDV